MSRRTAALEFDAIHIEGGLLPAEWLGNIAALKAAHQSPADYGIPKGLNLRDELGRYWRIAQAHWSEFDTVRSRADNPHALTARFVQALLREVFGATDLQPQAAPQVISERQYPVAAIAREGRLPLVVAAAGQRLDERDRRYGDSNRQRSAFGLLQDWLNASDRALWGIASNGLQLRLARDNASLTRPAWIEADLERIFSEERYADFSLLWLLVHASRFGNPDNLPQQCPLEVWREGSKEQGTRAREQLRQGVEEALIALGQGFLAQARNQPLRDALANGVLDRNVYFQQLLRQVYRLIFLLTIEERGLLHPADANADAVKLYADGYSLRRLRERARKRRAFDQHADLWDGLKPVLTGLAHGQPLLALPALGGLFAEDQCPDLDASTLGNRALLEAVAKLGWMRSEGSLARINWRDMGPEELGSVYESLLELVPDISADGRVFRFANDEASKGNARKTSGSYYTPDSLVQELLDSALEPVIQQRISGATDPEVALLSITVCDPACGSGHFLLGAARRLATRLAQLRAQGTPSGEDFRHALRDVITHCIFGVDRNPMAIELARMSLWLEAMTPDRPLGFLDHHLQCGDALLGLTNLSALEQGIPKDAFKALSGDDKEVCKALARQNATELKDLQRKHTAQAFGQRDLLGLRPGGMDRLRALEELPDDTLEQIANKQAAWLAFAQESADSPLRHAADMLLAAFLQPKTETTQDVVPTTGAVVLELLGEHAAPGHPSKREAANVACTEARVLHWPLAFPLVYAGGGFACLLGNPPWEVVQDRDGTLDKGAHEEQKKWFGVGIYSVLSGRRDLYKLFLTLAPSLLNSVGRCGFVLPLGFMFEEDCVELRKVLFDRGSVVSILHIQNNQRKFFASVHASYRFVAITFTNQRTTSHQFSTVVKSPSDLDGATWIKVDRERFDAVIGSDRSAVIFSNRAQSALHESLISKIAGAPLLEYRIVAEFHASSDKDLLKKDGSADDWGLVKSGSIHYFNPWFGEVEKWVSRDEVVARLIRKGLSPERWLDHPRLVFRDIARNDDTRTLIPCLIPPGLLSTYDAPMVVPCDEDHQSELALAFYTGYLSSFLADFIIRPYVDKHIKGYVLARVPIPEFSLDDALMRRGAELAYSIAKRGWSRLSGADYSDVSTHAFLERALLDAIFMKISGVERDEIPLIFANFNSIQVEEERKLGEYQTCRLVLEAFDTLDAKPTVVVPTSNIVRRSAPRPLYLQGATPASAAEEWLAGLVCDVLLQTGPCDETHLRRTVTTLLPANTPHADVLADWLTPIEAGRFAHVLDWLRRLLNVPSTVPISIRNPTALAEVIQDHRTESLARALIEARRQRDAEVTEVMAGDMQATKFDHRQKSG